MGQEESLNMVNNQDLFKLGSGWDYSNTNYILLGLIIEKLTSHSSEEISTRLIVFI